MADASPQDLLNLASAVRVYNRDWRRPVPLMDAGLGRRSIAAVIDLFFFSLLAILLCFLTFQLLGSYGGPLADARGWWAQTIAIFAAASVYLACDAGFGLTVGKACLGLRVVASVPGAFQRPLFMRWLFRCLPLFASILISVLGLCFVLLRTDATFTPSFWREFVLPFFLPFATLIVMLVVVSIPVGVDRQSWYDHFAGTRVVRRISARAARGFEPILRSDSAISEEQCAAPPPPPAPADSAPA